MSAPADGEDVT